QRSTSLPASSRSTTAPSRRFAAPSRTVLYQSQSSRSFVIPRFRTMFAYFLRPGSFRIKPASPPERYSMTSTSEERPEHSENAVAFSPVISSRKLSPENGSSRKGGMGGLLVADWAEV